MADVAKNQVERNAAGAVTAVAGAASQTIVYDRSDENITVHVANGDAADCMIRVATNGFGGGDADALDMNITAGEEIAFVLESMYYKDPATQSATLEILDQDGTAFSETVGNVVFRVLDAPKSLTD